MADRQRLDVDCSITLDEAAARPANMEKRMLANVRVDLQTEDALDAQGVSNDFIILAAHREDSLLAVPELVGSDSLETLQQQMPIPFLVRDACLRFMSNLAPIMDMQQKNWFEAVALFDTFCIRRTPRIELTHLPALCVALLKVLNKVDSRHSKFGTADLSSYTSSLAHSLRCLGFDASEGSSRHIATQEQNLLEATRWQVNLPSIESWFSAFYARFNLLTHGVFVQSLNWLWAQSMSYASCLVLQQPNCAPMPSRRLARGLVTVMLASVGLIAVQSLKPKEFSATEWLKLVRQCYPKCRMPMHVLRSQHDEQPLYILEVAMGVDSTSLQQDCKFVATLSYRVLQEYASQQKGSPANFDPSGHARSAPQVEKLLSPQVHYASC